MKDAEWGGLAAGTGATDQVPTGRRWDRGRTAAGYSTLEASEELLEVRKDQAYFRASLSRQLTPTGVFTRMQWACRSSTMKRMIHLPSAADKRPEMATFRCSHLPQISPVCLSRSCSLLTRALWTMDTGHPLGSAAV